MKWKTAQVVVNVKDSYDFNGDQFLGLWDDSDNSVSMLNLFSGHVLWLDKRVSIKRVADWELPD
jgi:hypothetical protein